MVIALPLPLALLQVAARADTIVALTIPDRGILEWTSGILQILVLLLAVAALVALIMLLQAMRLGIQRIDAGMARLADQTRPMLANANAMVGDARAMVAAVREDVTRVTDAAGVIGEELRHAAQTTARRVDDVNAVLDVLQGELEETALGAAAAIRGVRVGARALAGVFPRRRRRPKRRRDAD
ncbi:MAG: hypothetical protein LCH84_10630 [Gemmatimonadetes bacterium]|nr:hypothetical protein [Gemmatimonadota bacterium]